jgi:hypothetical protein
MATRQLDIMKNRGNHEVGNLCSWDITTLPFGAKCAEDIDNFLLVELDFDAEGQRVCKTLTDVGNKAYLIAAPENRMLGNVLTEELVDFYNGKDEFARIVVLEEMTRFESSAFSKNTGVTDIVNGMVAHFDPETKKYIVSSASAPHADYAGSSVKFTVVGSEENTEFSLCGKEVVKLEVQE